MSITYTSQLGQGSTFSFTLQAPALTETNAQPSSPTPTWDHTFAQRLPLKILIAEDNLTNQRLLQQMLQRLGYDADVVTNGAAALAAVCQQPYDLILMDIQMPEMDGLTATRQIQALNDRSPYIIGLSADAFQEARDAAIAAGMHDYLTKPLKLDALLHVLQRLSRPNVQ